MKTNYFFIPWPQGVSMEEIAEKPPEMPGVEKLVNDPQVNVAAMEMAKVHFYTKDWYCVTIKYEEQEK